MIPVYLQEQLRNFFFTAYYATDLENGFFAHVRVFLKTNRIFCLDQGVSDTLIGFLLKSKCLQAEMVRLCVVPFLNQALFDKFTESLPADIRTLMDYLVWNDGIDDQEIKAKFDIKIYEMSVYGGRKELIKTFRFFKVINEGYGLTASFILYLPVALRRTMAMYYPKPASAKITPIEKIPPTTFVFEGEKIVFNDLPNVSLFILQGNVVTTNRGELAVTGFKKLGAALNLPEFYPNTNVKELQYLRTRLLTTMGLLGEDLQIEKNPLNHLKNLFGRYRLFDHLQLLTYLKGRHNVSRSSDAYGNYLQIGKLLPLGEWVSVDNLLDYAKYEVLPLEPGSRDAIIIYVKYEIDKASYAIKPNNIETVITTPALQATLFLWAALGLVDIAYNTPKINAQTPSQYSGLKYVRLTPLGSYLFDTSNDYTPPEFKTIPNPVLSPDSLTIIAHPDDNTAPVMFSSYTSKMSSENAYYTSYAIFMQNCSSFMQLKNKVDAFKTALKDLEIPDNWHSFLNTMLAQANPFKNASTHRLIQIPADNINLMRLIARDAELKKYIIKAEEFHIVVFGKYEHYVKQRLKELGYLWE